MLSYPSPESTIDAVLFDNLRPCYCRLKTGRIGLWSLPFYFSLWHEYRFFVDDELPQTGRLGELLVANGASKNFRIDPFAPVEIAAVFELRYL